VKGYLSKLSAYFDKSRVFIGICRYGIKPIHGKLACDVTRADLAAVLAGAPDSSRNNYLRTLRAVFRHGQDLGFLKELPVRKGDFAEIKKTEVDVLAVSKVRQLLEAALLTDLALLPLLLIETICGVRPAEAARVQFSDLDFVRKRLTVRAAISKTGSARIIQLAPCALAWFQAYAATKKRITAGAICPWSASILRSRMRKLRSQAGFNGDDGQEEWNPGSLRDAFCSYHLAHYGSIDRLITESGHTNLRTTKDHYLGLVSKEQAAAFWNLFPPGKDKIIDIRSVRAG
jgi:integrase